MKENNRTNTRNKTSRIVVITILVICLVGFSIFLAIRTQEMTIVDPTALGTATINDEVGHGSDNEQVVMTTTSEAVVSTRAVDIEESKDLDAEVQKRYEGEGNVSYYVVIAEIMDPTFNQAFPEAQLYKVKTDAPTLDDDDDTFTLMATYKGKNYRMPLDFNQLVFDAGYVLDEESLNILVPAFVVAGLRSDMIGQPVICEEGNFIDEQMGRFHYEFATQCAIGEINGMQIWLRDFDSQFHDGLMSWGNITEYGWHEFNREFSPGGVNQ